MGVIEELRVARNQVPEFNRVVIALDPAVSCGENSDETGIVVAALGSDRHGYVLADESGRYQPNDWAKKAISLYYKYAADRIVAETNQGGLMVEATLRAVDPNVSFRDVHAKRGKLLRAEPISALYEQGRKAATTAARASGKGDRARMIADCILMICGSLRTTVGQEFTLFATLTVMPACRSWPFKRPMASSTFNSRCAMLAASNVRPRSLAARNR
jgi:Terminase RNaseH-like domain